MTDKPLLYLDVDGVLCPFDDPGGYERVLIAGQDGCVWYSSANATRLATLATRFSFVWATAWQHNANVHIAPLHGLEPLPVIEWKMQRLADAITREDRGYCHWKLPWIDNHANGRWFAWIDDKLTNQALAWAARREPATLFVATDPNVGLTDGHVNALLRFADQCASESGTNEKRGFPPRVRDSDTSK